MEQEETGMMVNGQGADSGEFCVTALVEGVNWAPQ